MAKFGKTQYSTLAIIPARSGSKSIPKKNIYPLGGAPLISYAIRAAKNARSVGRVIVTTDDEEIASVARSFGAEVPFLRPSELAGDKTPTIPVIQHALEWLEANEGIKPDHVLLLQPTEPFVTPGQIDKVFELVCEKKADSGITMVPLARNVHPYHVRVITEGGLLEFEKPELHYAHPNRQSDPKRYAFGNLYWFSGEVFRREKKIEVGKRVGLEIDPFSAHDINSKEDLVLAEFLMERKLV